MREERDVERKEMERGRQAGRKLDAFHPSFLLKIESYYFYNAH
jgi:hypothetical protein